MRLLAGITFAEKLTVIILCVSALVLMVFNIYLVVSLHLRNKKLFDREEAGENAEDNDSSGRRGICYNRITIQQANGD